MYPVVSTSSFLIRFAVCFMTIEQYPIFQDPGADWMLGQIVSIYTLLLAIAYAIVGNISAGSRMSGTDKSLVYFVIYLGLIAIVYAILFVLTFLNILPII